MLGANMVSAIPFLLLTPVFPDLLLSLQKKKVFSSVSSEYSDDMILIMLEAREVDKMVNGK